MQSLRSLALVLVAAVLALVGLPGSTPAASAAVAAPIAAAATDNPVGTMLLVHGGGWGGPDSHLQQLLIDQPGDMLVARGWRVVSIDYEAGTAGLQNLVDAVQQELAQRSAGPLCLYGESAGGQMSLLVAARFKQIDCVVAAAPPTDFEAYLAEAAASGDANRLNVGQRITSTFGATPAERAQWEPIRVADEIDASVLMLHQSDDGYVPADQLERFRAARPTTQVAELEAAPGPFDIANWWCHGTLSDAGRAQYRALVGSFADRAVVAHRTAREAERTTCPAVNARLVPGDDATLRDALRCLARHDAAKASLRRVSAGAARVRLRGEVTAARIWAALRRSAAGTRALRAVAARRARMTVRLGDVSVVTVRARR